MVYEKKCVVCGKTFTTNVANKTKCCAECVRVFTNRYNKASRERRLGLVYLEKTCAACGKKFRTTDARKKCCCSACSEEYRKKDAAARTARWKASLSPKRRMEHAEKQRRHNQIPSVKERRKRNALARLEKLASEHPDILEDRKRRKHEREVARRNTIPGYAESKRRKNARYMRNKRKKALEDIKNNIVSPESVWLLHVLEYNREWLSKHPDRVERYKADRAFKLANSNNAAIWLSLGIYE